jgi:guanylate kinase
MTKVEGIRESQQLDRETKNVQACGRLIILSGPSGAGKSTLLRKLLAGCPLPLELSVSYTTRKQRIGEVNGRDYHFVSAQRFQDLRAAGMFLECKEVFGRGDWYGTPAEHVDQRLLAGKWVILEIDVQGAMSVLEQRPDTLSFFVHPGSLEELEARLRGRGTEEDTAILRRLEVAADELRSIHHYRYEIINRDIEHSANEICQLLQQYR